MASSKLISTHLRRTSFSFLRPFLLSLSSSSSLQSPSPTTSIFTTSSRYFSSQPSESHFTHNLNSITESELRSLGFIDGSQLSNVADKLLDDSILPIHFIVSLLDGYHDLTGFPWWIVIASSTLAMRITLFPWILLQLHKLQQIDQVRREYMDNNLIKILGALAVYTQKFFIVTPCRTFHTGFFIVAMWKSEVPPPFPPLFSGRSFTKHFSIFWRKKQALGCPSFLWFLGPWAVQLPCFLLCMTSVRRMALDQYPGFDTGGILWFQNLTEIPNGPFGPIAPVLIAGLHFCNIQIGFRSSFAAKGEGLLHSLAKLYKMYLEFLTLPILFLGFHIPQGSLVYWVTNSSLTLIQQLCLKDPAIRQKLGLLNRPENAAADHERNLNESAPLVPDAPKKPAHVSAFDLSPLQLVNLAVTYLSAGRNDKALRLLRVAVDKDPECYMAWSVMGQLKVQQKDFEGAAEYFEFAISKISYHENPTDQAIDFLIQASMYAGAAYYQQGKVAESFAHFERLKDMEVPEEPIGKGRYYEGLMVYAGCLFKEGRKDEALKYTQMASAYDPQYSTYLETFEKDADSFVSDLASSRRADY